MMYEFLLGTLAILGAFVILGVLADFVIPALFPALFEEDGE